MRYLCNIYTHGAMPGHADGGASHVATVTLSGRSPREAAARAYVRCVGRQRARVLREERRVRRAAVVGETDVSGIAASLRKTASPDGPCYQLDNFVDGWAITVQPAAPIPPPLLARLRPPLPRRLLALLHPSPN